MHSCVHYLRHIVFDPISLWEEARISLIVFATLCIVLAVFLLVMPEDHNGL